MERVVALELLARQRQTDRAQHEGHDRFNPHILMHLADRLRVVEGHSGNVIWERDSASETINTLVRYSRAGSKAPSRTAHGLSKKQVL